MSPYTKEEFAKMFETKTLLLKGRRWRRFNEAIVWAMLFMIMWVCAAVVSMIKNGFHWAPVLFIIVPILFLTWWSPNKDKELRFYELTTEFNKKENHEFVLAALKKLEWKIGYTSIRFTEAYENSKNWWTWGDNMVTVLIEDNRILINCVTNLDVITTQAGFTFGELTRIVKRLEQAVWAEIYSKEKQSGVT